jgi:hypothetical protein
VGAPAVWWAPAPLGAAMRRAIPLAALVLVLLMAARADAIAAVRLVVEGGGAITEPTSGST